MAGAEGQPYTPTPIIYGDYFYTCADNGVLSAYNAKTGALIYQERLPSSFSASPVAADGKLYMVSEDGDAYVVRAGPKFELLATNPMGEALMSTPAISDGMPSCARRVTSTPSPTALRRETKTR